MMTSWVYMNGSLKQEQETFISSLDRSYLYGEGLFETMKATRGFIPFLPEHLERLFQGTDLLKMKLDLSAAKLEFALYQTLHHNQLKDAYLRLTVSRENLEIGQFEVGEKTNFIVFAKPLPVLPAHTYTLGVSAHVVEQFKISPDALCQVKSTNYLRHLLSHRLAREAQATEALLLNTSGRVVEGATSNLFVFDGKKLKTPPLSEGALAGITRRILLETMKKYGLACEESLLTREELQTAAEAFLTNSIKEIVPLTRVDDRVIGHGRIGPHTLKVMQYYKEEVQFRFENYESRRWGGEKHV